MPSFTCSKCGTHRDEYMSYASLMPTQSAHVTNYPICWHCYREWHYNGHHKMWRILYNSNSFELANKFVLDFLGKLG